MSAPFFLGLLHHPVLNRKGEVVTTSVTNLDIHDIARSARTYEVDGYFVAHPSAGLRALCERVAWHWQDGHGAKTNESRRLAMERVRIVADLDAILTSIEQQCGRLPLLVATSARPQGRPTISFEDLREHRGDRSDPMLLLLGTGYGLSPDLVARCDFLLQPIHGPGDYNHLSVRAAASILLDRLFGH